MKAEKEEVEDLLEEIRTKSEKATIAQEGAKTKKIQLDLDNIEIEKQQKEADEILKAAIPLLEEAAAALLIIKVDELV